ncbi:MAG: primosomal protein N' [Deltaproteobacteria bacterium]|nr:primosomal protein N' [Deltaproteobacteria bacterium]
MTEKEKYIHIAVALPVNKTFTYSVPEHLAAIVAVGKRVLVPFGKRKVSGYILDITASKGVDATKPVHEILDHQPLFPPAMVQLFEWTADYYLFPIGMVIKNALPAGLHTYERPALTITPEGREALNAKILAPMEETFLKKLSSAGPLRPGDLGKSANGLSAAAMLQQMIDQGWIESVRMLKADGVRAKMQRHASLIEKKLPDTKISAARQKIVDVLRREGPLPISRLRSANANAPALIRKMAEEGYVAVTSERIYRDPLGQPVQSTPPPELTAEQKKAVEAIGRTVGKGFAPFLLAGVTGSGKTEVYMRLARHTLDIGLSVLVLVPEISLISQMERRFRARFGDRIAVLHSGLSAGERLDQWQKVMNRRVEIAIGARSAVFAPLDRIGLIIVDEEHDTSYKQEGALRYNARDLAVIRARQQHATVLLGSATPSIQSYHNAMRRKYSLVKLTKRVEQRHLPEINVVDLCRSRDHKGLRKFFSEELLTALTETMARDEQAILFLNRRGFANFPVCASCGSPVTCKNCDITLTFHKKHNAFRCHYCGFSMPSVSNCPACGSPKIHKLGIGTEKVASAAESLFPEKTIVRMDRDTVTRKGSVIKILKGLRSREIDILVGTQMVTKGHDFPGITLVGIICADLSLSFPDFRAGERTFQLLAQVAGRAGRGETPGRVILQTYNPKHFSIQCAESQDFDAFYRKEIISRQALDYPPFSRMVQIKISSRDQDRGRRQAKALGDLARSLIGSDPKFKKGIRVYGPLEAPFAKIASHHRWQMLLKGLTISVLRDYIRRLLFDSQVMRTERSVKTAVDVDPFFMM